jgi:phosphoribosylformimino-5-aminoimidazole carboxamide ribotide isomerase
MELLPAIDLKNGQCVRLTQGDFASAKVYEADPLIQARKFADAGATWLHVVDLDGARDGKSRQFDIIAQLAQQASLNMQVGGGIRSSSEIETLLNFGVKRVIIGSLAARNPALVKSWLKDFGPKCIVLAFDVRLDAEGEPEVLTNGWQSNSKQSLWDLLATYTESGLRTILCTDVSRDGTLKGSNHTLYQIIRERQSELDILASGGISDLSDLQKLAGLGMAGAIIGKAIYEGRIDLAAAVRGIKNAG